jgi:hypothetical protein
MSEIKVSPFTERYQNSSKFKKFQIRRKKNHFHIEKKRLDREIRRLSGMKGSNGNNSNLLQVIQNLFQLNKKRQESSKNQLDQLHEETLFNELFPVVEGWQWTNDLKENVINLIRHHVQLNDEKLMPLIEKFTKKKDETSFMIDVVETHLGSVRNMFVKCANKNGYTTKIASMYNQCIVAQLVTLAKTKTIISNDIHMRLFMESFFLRCMQEACSVNYKSINEILSKVMVTCLCKKTWVEHVFTYFDWRQNNKEILINFLKTPVDPDQGDHKYIINDENGFRLIKQNEYIEMLKKVEWCTSLEMLGLWTKEGKDPSISMNQIDAFGSGLLCRDEKEMIPKDVENYGCKEIFALVRHQDYNSIMYKVGKNSKDKKRMYPLRTPIEQKKPVFIPNVKYKINSKEFNLKTNVELYIPHYTDKCLLFQDNLGTLHKFHKDTSRVVLMASKNSAHIVKCTKT